MEVAEVGLCQKSSRFLWCSFSLEKIIAVIVLVIHVLGLSVLLVLHTQEHTYVHFCVTRANGAATIGSSPCSTLGFVLHEALCCCVTRCKSVAPIINTPQQIIGHGQEHAWHCAG